MIIALFAIVSPLVVVFAFPDVPVTTTVRPHSTPPIEDNWFVSRAKWSASPSQRPLTPVSAPWRRAIIIHTATEPCKDLDACGWMMRFIQKQHINNNNFSDISYNFVVGGDGRVYEGIGWNFTGSHTPRCNDECLGVAFVGDYRSKEADTRPTALQIASLGRLLSEGVVANRLIGDYKVIAHCQARATESPGDNLYNEILTWDQYSPDDGNFSGRCEWPTRRRTG